MPPEQLTAGHKVLVCPVTKQSLAVTKTAEALDVIGGKVWRLATDARENIPDVETLLLRKDHAGAYPVVDGIPILMAPEMLASVTSPSRIDTTVDPYREAYEEMDFYDAYAQREQEDITQSPIYRAVKEAAAGGDLLTPAWINATFDPAAQLDSYKHLAPVTGQRTMQIGGRGVHAVKFLVAGADESWLVTPMLGEALFARELAKSFGLEDRLHCVVAIGEELPFSDLSFDSVYSAGCIHHTITEIVFPEIARVLRPGGRFAALEPWKAPLYNLGTKILGKREVGVNCRPIDSLRVEPLFSAFETSSVIHHGTLSRYPLLALHKLGITTGVETNRRITVLDDRMASLLPPLRRYGSSVALLGTKSVA